MPEKNNSEGLNRLTVSDVNQIRSDRCPHTLAFVADDEDPSSRTLGCLKCGYKLGPKDLIFQLRAPKAELFTGSVSQLVAEAMSQE